MDESKQSQAEVCKRFVSLNQRVQDALKHGDADNVLNFTFELDKLLTDSALAFGSSELWLIDSQMKLTATTYIRKQPMVLLKAIADFILRIDSIIGFSKFDSSGRAIDPNEGRYYITVGDDGKSLTHSRRVFVVHGRDEDMKQSVARTIEKMGLEPLILHEPPDEGKTVIEKFESYSDVGFAVVLLSPDDVAYPKGSKPRKPKLRARQNVILELGFFLGKLGRNKVCSIYREAGNFEMPSDYAGVLYIPYDESGAWRLKLAKELKAAGYDIDVEKFLQS